MTQEFELLELNLIHTQAKYNSPGWKWSRTPELIPLPKSLRRFGDKQSEPHFCFSTERKASIIWQALPTMAGQGVQAHCKEVCFPLIHHCLLHQCYSLEVFYSKVYLLDSWVNTILGGKVESQFYSMCQSWAADYILCCFFIASPKALAVGKA